MNKKYLFLVIIPFLTISSVYAMPGALSFDDFCDKKTTNTKTTAADFICELDIFQMKDDVTSNKSRLAILENVLFPDTPYNLDSIVTIQTENNSYIKGDEILFFGKVTDRLDDPHVNITVTDPNYNIVVHIQTPLNDDGTWTAHLISDNRPMKYDGEYYARVTYQDHTHYALTSFTFNNQLPVEN